MSKPMSSVSTPVASLHGLHQTGSAFRVRDWEASRAVVHPVRDRHLHPRSSGFKSVHPYRFVSPEAGPFAGLFPGVPTGAVLDNWDRFTPSGLIGGDPGEWLAVTVFAYREP